jgi:hypothetical protein
LFKVAENAQNSREAVLAAARSWHSSVNRQEKIRGADAIGWVIHGLQVPMAYVVVFSIDNCDI